jgi:hypothetical protein
VKEQPNNADLKTAFKHAANLLGTNPVLAQEQEEEILMVVADSPSAKHILSTALRLQGNTAEGLATIEPIAKQLDSDANVLHEYALCLRQLLDYCEPPFEDHCLRFYETECAIQSSD